MSTHVIERMSVEIDGRGDAVVMVHGLGGSSNFFQPLMTLFEPRTRVVRPDLPGSGRSPAPEAVSIAGFVDALARLCGVIGVERAHFLGHSLGSIICQHLAVQHPRLVRSLGLLGPLLAPPEPVREGLRRRAQQARSEGMAEIAVAVANAATSADTRMSNPVGYAMVRELLMRQCPGGYAASCEALAAAEPADVARIRVPTALITGDEDAIAPPSSVRALADRIAGARVHVLARCGHWTVLERPREVASLLRDFVFGRGTGA
jgi:pimeloyl-ACP methyl ester carboxylesterase